MFTMNNNKPVWIRDNDHGFILGKITDIGSDQATIQLVETRKVKRNLQIAFLSLISKSILFVLLRVRWFHMIRYFKQKNTTKMSMITVSIYLNEFSFQRIIFLDIIGALMYLNEATLLNNLRRRYKKDSIYVRRSTYVCQVVS